MPKSTITFVCTECGGESIRWAGQCPHCRAWNTLQEFQVREAARDSRSRPHEAARPLPLSEIGSEDAPRMPLGWGELNRVLGGGVVPGSIVLIGGEPGVGKSTLLMHAAAQVARVGKVLYVSGEESGHQVRMRAQRLGALEPNILLLAENDLDAICEAIRSEAPGLAVIDSIQTVTDAGFEGSAGSVTQVRESAARLMRLAKETGVPVFLVGHVTKEGSIAGPRVLEHIVDTVLYLEGDRRQELRILRATKNRFGSAEEIGVFAMGEAGLEEVPDPSAAILAGAASAAPGTVIVAAMEGTRPLLVEVQSLVNKTQNSMVRRVANGIDLNRLHMILAVIEKRLQASFGSSDIFVSVAGGIRITEPAADLGLALSIVSNESSRPMPDGLIVIGELGLAGEVRRVSQLERRLQEAARHGLTRALIPAGARAGRHSGLDVVEVRSLAEAVSAVFSSPIKSGAYIQGAGLTVS
ncbi:MAG: DNA repair protein RadA [Chloroflexi bacterium]|nr:MAG: DNA repair protein RadA [Chloroflexota bacterium]TMF93149.1 MAG: DNA repair protein RadA [Chloroflexota bacterium]TMG45504.1 MAG: DNA repair protein RadA [Chloroflexota bacterium]